MQACRFSVTSNNWPVLHSHCFRHWKPRDINKMRVTCHYQSFPKFIESHQTITFFFLGISKSSVNIYKNFQRLTQDNCTPRRWTENYLKISSFLPRNQMISNLYRLWSHFTVTLFCSKRLCLQTWTIFFHFFRMGVYVVLCYVVIKSRVLHL